MYKIEFDDSLRAMLADIETAIDSVNLQIKTIKEYINSQLEKNGENNGWI